MEIELQITFIYLYINLLIMVEDCINVFNNVDVHRGGGSWVFLNAKTPTSFYHTRGQYFQYKQKYYIQNSK